MENQDMQNPRPVYPAAPYRDASPLTVGDYFVMLLISLIPVVNLIMLLVWGFGNSNLNRRNYARAQLIFVVIGIVLGIVFGATIWSALTSMGSAF